MSGAGLSVVPMKPKERYEKPELLVIELKAEEVLAVGLQERRQEQRGPPTTSAASRRAATGGAPSLHLPGPRLEPIVAREVRLALGGFDFRLSAGDLPLVYDADAPYRPFVSPDPAAPPALETVRRPLRGLAPPLLRRPDDPGEQRHLVDPGPRRGASRRLPLPVRDRAGLGGALPARRRGGVRRLLAPLPRDGREARPPCGAASSATRSTRSWRCTSSGAGASSSTPRGPSSAAGASPSPACPGRARARSPASPRVGRAGSP